MPPCGAFLSLCIPSIKSCWSATVDMRRSSTLLTCSHMLRRRVEMVCGQTSSFSARDKSSTARSLMGLTTSKTTHFTGAARMGICAHVAEAVIKCSLRSCACGAVGKMVGNQYLCMCSSPLEREIYCS